MKAIAAVDKNWGIGFRNKLLERIPEDMKFFTNITLGKVVVMGRETYESLPGTRPLKNRINIVLSSKMQKNMDGITVCGSMEQLFGEISRYPYDDIIIIGGATVYGQMLPYCSEALITKFSNVHEADSFFPDMDKNSDWRVAEIFSNMVWNGMEYSRVKYVNNKIKQFP